MARQIIVGDVHGCLPELRELIAKLQLTADDHLVFVGDLINKGADSAGVVDLVRWVGRNLCRCDSVMGNHEEKLTRWVNHRINEDIRGIPNPMPDSSGRLSSQASQFTNDQIAFMANFPLYIRLAAPANALVVHGGINPHLTELPKETRRRDVSAKVWTQVERLIRCRFVDQQGHGVALKNVNAAHHFWATNYDGRLGRVIFGHQSWNQEQFMVFDNAIGVDLGCVYGHFLGALIFDTERSGYRSLVIKAKNASFYAAGNSLVAE